ncbi:MAG: SWIM zinc finger family protein [Oscillospiraceae bacterium]|nr:SWIM zinc finger family protein [Oscillospiraceae bacterium]
MSTASKISEDLIRSSAPNAACAANGLKISRSRGFVKLYKTEDETLIFGDCKGSGASLYKTSIDLSGEAPVYRCSCPSRQIPCKHCVGIMYDWLAQKEFEVSDIPEDIAAKREKIEKKAKANEDSENSEKKPKQNKAAAQKKLKKQKEGLELAYGFVNELLSRGVSSVTSSSAQQYKNLAKQLGDYYLPAPQAVMTEIVSAAYRLSASPDDTEIHRITSLCVRLSSTVRKCMDYIDKKLESGEVLPDDNTLYEAMGNVWKLSQLKEIGLYKENAKMIQLSFNVIYDDLRSAEIDKAYWADLDTGEISQTQNIRPLRAAGYINAMDSAFGVHSIRMLYSYPGGINKRIRWENADIADASPEVFAQVLSIASQSISETIKKAKNELKNTLSAPSAAVLLKFDKIEFSDSDSHPVLKLSNDTIALRSNSENSCTCRILRILSHENLTNGAVLGELYYRENERRIYLCPISIVNNCGIIRLV